tara:strand:- start:121 stop:321 length:201 start_codon:yes stop_codon:yes gene_type:complete
MTTLAETMTITLQHTGGSMVKFTPATAGRVWYDTYYKGAATSHMAIRSDDTADIIMDLMNNGFYVA